VSDARISDEEPDRTTRLEMRMAEQERAVEELSGEVARQWKVIEKLERQAERMAERFLSLEEALRPAPATKPPHW
jgi:SlyX protein